jgi:ABC-type Fe3+ transport system permease subunit
MVEALRAGKKEKFFPIHYAGREREFCLIKWVASHSLRSFSIPLMLGTRNSKVLLVVVWDLWEQGSAGPTAVLAVLLNVALGVITVTGRWLVSRLSGQV